MKKINSSKIVMYFVIGFLIGYLCYIPIYVALIPTFIVSFFCWYKIGLIAKEAANKKIKKVFCIIPFYKIALTIIGYGLIEAPYFFNVPELNVFSELNFGMVLLSVVSQIQPMVWRLSVTFPNYCYEISFLLALVLSMVPIMGFYIAKNSTLTKTSIQK